MSRRLRTVAPFAAAALSVTIAAAAVPAKAGILINQNGIFLTSPDPSLAPALNPNTGFRRFGRAGVFAQPRDPGLAFSGRNAFGPDGRKLDDKIRTGRQLGAERRLFQQLFSFD